MNPISDNMKLISLSSGLIPAERAAEDMLAAECKGETEVLKFIDEWLVSGSWTIQLIFSHLMIQSSVTTKTGVIYINSEKTCQNEAWQGCSKSNMNRDNKSASWNNEWT